MDSTAASLAVKPIVLRPGGAIQASSRDPLCLLWRVPALRQDCAVPRFSHQDEATDPGVVVWSPPTPPVVTLILGPAKPPEIGPFWGRISPVFWALRCKVVGGWGGSAHYPDPTAQSAEAAEQPPPTRARHAGAAAGPPQPASASPNLPKSSTFLLFSVVVESWRSRRFERGRGATIAARCAPRPVGAPLRPAVPKS